MAGLSILLTGEFSSVDRYSRIYKDPDWRTNGLATPTQATDNLLANRHVEATKLANNIAVTNHSVASITKVSETTRAVQVGRKYEWDVVNVPFVTGVTGWYMLASGSVNDYSYATWGSRALSVSDMSYIASKFATNDDLQGTNMTQGLMQSWLNAYDFVESYAREEDAPPFETNDWMVSFVGKNLVYSDDYFPSHWVFKQYYDETFHDYVFDLDT